MTANDNQRPITAMTDQELKAALLTLTRLQAEVMVEIEQVIARLGKIGVAMNMVNAEFDRRGPKTGRAN